MFISVKRVSN